MTVVFLEENPNGLGTPWPIPNVDGAFVGRRYFQLADLAFGQTESPSDRGYEICCSADMWPF
jgi:hypothetical protein